MIHPTLVEVLDRHALSGEVRVALLADLVDREDMILDHLRLAGMQFGLFPQIVAEVFAQVGMGSPLSDEERALIQRQFEALMTQLREQYGIGDDPV